MKNKELNYYEEIDIPPKENLAQGLKPFLEAELKKRNLVCLLSVIAISFMISEYASRGNGLLDHLLQKCEILSSPFVTSGLILLAFYSFDRFLKRSTVYRVYKTKRLGKSEKYFFLYGFSVWVAAISSSFLFNALRVLRLVIHYNRFTRSIYHVAALLACWLPHALGEIQPSELSVRIVDINMYLIERVLWLPVALLLVLLFKSIVYTTIFENLVYNKKMKSLDDIESKLRAICDTYRNSISSPDAESNYSLAVKGFGVVIVCHILRLKALFLISLKERFVFITKTFVWLSNLILIVNNAVIFTLKNYSTGLILAVEVFAATFFKSSAAGRNPLSSELRKRMMA